MNRIIFTEERANKLAELGFNILNGKISHEYFFRRYEEIKNDENSIVLLEKLADAFGIFESGLSKDQLIENIDGRLKDLGVVLEPEPEPEPEPKTKSPIISKFKLSFKLPNFKLPRLKSRSSPEESLLRIFLWNMLCITLYAILTLVLAVIFIYAFASLLYLLYEHEPEVEQPVAQVFSYNDQDINNLKTIHNQAISNLKKVHDIAMDSMEVIQFQLTEDIDSMKAINTSGAKVRIEKTTEYISVGDASIIPISIENGRYIGSDGKALQGGYHNYSVIKDNEIIIVINNTTALVIPLSSK